jgi:thiol-disulfide isomerase/thioredoxin
MGKKGSMLAFILFLVVSFSCGLAQGETKPLGFAIPFPDLIFTQSLSREEQNYLGIPSQKGFSFREITGNLILVEFLSTYCINCQRQAPIFNEVYSSIERDSRRRHMTSPTLFLAMQDLMPI